MFAGQMRPEFSVGIAKSRSHLAGPDLKMGLSTLICYGAITRAFNSIRHIITRSAMVKFRRKFLGSTQVPATKNPVFYVPFIPYIAGTAAWPEFYAARKLSLELSLEPPGCGCHGRSGLLRALSSQSTQTPSSTIPLAWRRFCIGGE